MNAKKHTPLSLHGLRLLFPPLATLGILFLTEWIARGSLTGETFTQYIFPHAEAYLLAWAMLFLSWLAVSWLTGLNVISKWTILKKKFRNFL